MNSLRKVVLVLLIATALGTAVVAPASAAASAETLAAQAPTLTCDGGTCQLFGAAAGPLGLAQSVANLALTQLPFKTTADGSNLATLDIRKDLTLSLPVGDVTLTNARLQAEVDAGGKITRLNGSSDMPFPTFGLLDDARIVTPARANVGLDLGKNLPDTGLDLDPDRSYLFFAADTAMSVAGRTAGSAEDFSLSFAPGQRATLVIDTVEPVAYLDGQVTLSLVDQIAFLGGLLESTPIAEYVPDTLPLRERTQYGLSGKFNKNVAESRLTLRGGYVLDPGLLPAQLGVDAQLVSLLGELTLSRDGVLVDGVLKSAIEPDKIFDGSMHIETFISLNPVAGPSYAGLDASVKIPVAKLGLGAGAKAGAGIYELSGELNTPFTSSALKGKVAGELPDVAGTVGPAVNQAAGAVGVAAAKAAATIRDYARSGVGLAGNALSAGRAKLNGEAAPATAADR